MQTVIYRRTGRPDEVVELTDADVPPPDSGEVSIDVEAAPINPSHLLALEGRYGVQPPLPAVPGAEGVGRIVALGNGVANFAVGQRVMIPAYAGSWRQRLNVAAQKIAVTYPDDGDPVQLSMLMANPPTAHLLLTKIVELSAGDWLIQNAANSAVGQYLIQLAQLRGFKTVNIVRRDGLADHLASLGADIVLVDGPDLADRVREQTSNAAIRFAIDAVAGDATARLAACLADGGTIANYGLLSGENCQVPAADLVFRDIRLQGFWFTRWLAEGSTAEERASVYRTLADLVIAEKLKARVAASYPLGQIKQAVAHAMQSGRDGKVVLVPNLA